MNKSVRNRRSRTESHTAPTEVWLWGTHAVQAALANPARTVRRLVASKNAANRLGLQEAEIAGPAEIAALLPAGAVHQGVALLSAPLEPAELDAVLADRPARIAVLDQVEDPRNLGAIFRSAAAFGIEALILQTRHSPPLTGTVAKSAAGAIEMVREVRVVNIARALEAVADGGYATIGLAGEAQQTLSAALGALPGPHCIVLGAEGAGLRPAVAKACQTLARIPMAARMESLNVSNAAAIAFHECSRGAFSPD